MKNLISIALLLLISATTIAQDFDVALHGYIGVDAAYDSRSSVTARNRHVYLYPLPEDLSDTGDDLNEREQLDLDAAHSRFGLDIKGPAIGGFSTSGMIQGDFIGNGRVDSYFRLRHAFISLSNEKWTFLAGQTWHPIFVTGNLPGTVNANAGAPFHPLIRSPQVSVTRKLSPSTRLSFFVVDQNNFRSSGFGSNSTEEALFPELDARLQWNTPGMLVALTGGVKTLAVPQEISGVVPAKKVSSGHVSASFRYNLPKISIRMEGIYGGNLTEMVMLGGVGQSLSDGEYVPLTTGSLWTDIQSNNSNGWQPGFFAGYTANMGAHEEVTVVEELSRSNGQVQSVYALSPRLRYVFDAFWIGAEWLYSNAAWGDDFDQYGVPQNTENYKNHRLLLSLRYNF